MIYYTYILINKKYMEISSLWSAFAIWFAALWVALGQGFFIYKAMKLIWKDPKLSGFFLTLTILGIALVESAAIYGLVVAYKLLSVEFVSGLAAIGPWLAIWLTGFWAWIWEWMLIQSAFVAINKAPDERNKIMTYMILFVALIETSAIYGIIVSFKIMYELDIESFISIWAWLAIGLTWLWVPIGEAIIGRKTLLSLDYTEDNSRLIIPLSILGIALVESAAIYGLIISFTILQSPGIWMLAISSGLAIGLAWFWASLWESFLFQKSIEKIAEKKANTSFLLTFAVLWVALVESAAIYGFIVAYKIISIDSSLGVMTLWAALAIGLTALWVGIWEWYLASKAAESMSSDEEHKTKILSYTVLCVALVESVAIYGTITAFKILGFESDIGLVGIWAWLAIGLSGLWVALWESFLASEALSLIGKRPKLSNFLITVTILWIALVESAAIYGFVTTFYLLSNAPAGLLAVSSGVAIGLPALWVWIAEGFIVRWAFDSIARNPANKISLLTMMILFIALVEVLAIYGMIIAFKLIS